MTRSFLFAAASAALALAALLLPRERRHWADAMRAELGEMESGLERVRFAFGCLFAAAREAASHIVQRLAKAAKRGSPMPILAALSLRPRYLGMLAAVAATVLGLVYLASAGAPARLLVVNGVALIIGFAVLAMALAAARKVRLSAGAVSVALGSALMAVSLFGLAVEGASRWMTISGFVIQPSLIIVPVLLAYCARARDAIAMTGVMLAAVALALQPDRAMAGVLVAGMGVLALSRSDARVLAALAVSVTAFAATMLQPDTLPAMPYVDQIVFTAFNLHLLAGLAVAAGLAWMIVPAVVGWLGDPANGEAYGVFGVVWLAVIVAAVLGNYPTPLVGYGASAIIGYAVSLIALPSSRGTAPVRDECAPNDAGTKDGMLRLSLA